MSKEQIRIICDDARALTDNDNKMIRCHINIKHFDWLIEQAERVQELERELEANYDDRQLDIDYLKRENSNYREALEVAFLRLSNKYNIAETRDDILKALKLD